ncbi:MAG: amidohydrolase family protein [Planctomycetota bacterium]
MKERPSEVVDVHTCIQPWQMLKPDVLEHLTAGRHDMDRLWQIAEDPREMVRALDDAGISRAALINYPSPELMGFTSEVNDWVAAYCRAFPNRLIPAGSIHPRHVGSMAAEFDRLVRDLGLRFLVVHPTHQEFFPNAYRDDESYASLEVLYHKCEQAQIPIMFQTGTSNVPGARWKYGDPLPLDDVAIDFPKLRVILAQGGRPFWMSQSFYLMRRYPNFYLDISGIPPRKLLEYFPRLEEIGDRTLFGSDWPSPGVHELERNVDDFCSLPLPADLQAAILGGNALSLFKLGSKKLEAKGAAANG